MLHLLGFQHTPESAELLYNAVHESFWGDTPIFSPESLWQYSSMQLPELSIKYTQSNKRYLRRLAVAGLKDDFPPSLGCIYLEELANEYPVHDAYQIMESLYTQESIRNFCFAQTIYNYVDSNGFFPVFIPPLVPDL